MRCPYCNHITDDDSMFCASCGRKIEPRGNTYQHTTEMPKMSLYEDDFDMEEERKGKSSSSSVPVIIAIIIAVCLLITAGVAAWFLLNHRTDTSSDNSVSNELKTELNESTNKKIKEEKESKKKKEDADKAKKEDSEKEEETKEEAEAEEKTDNYILPDSSKRILADSEVSGLTKSELRLARNEIFARHGRMFDDQELQDYFNSKSWYRGTIRPEDFSESMLSETEKANIETIKKYE